MKINMWIKKMLGMVEKEDHKVQWRRKLTIDGVFWERIHYPYVQNGPQWHRSV